MDPKIRRYLHIAVALIGVWLIAKGVAGIYGYDLDAMVGNLLP
jgi:hypothetical protein